MSDFGINIRQTLAYVTDGATDYYAGQDGSGYLTVYPSLSLGGVTSGWDASTSVDCRNRSTGVDVRLAGHGFSSGSNPSVFRIDLPATGTYDIWYASGDNSYALASTNKVAIYDNATLVDSQVGGTSAAARWLDAGHVERTASAWATNGAAPSGTSKITYNFASTTFWIKLGDGTNTGTLAHLHLTSVAGGPTVITGADSASLSISESSSILATQQREDSILLGLSEDLSAQVRLAIDEILATGFTESTSILAVIQREDEPAVIIVEASSVIDLLSGLVSITTSESLSLGLADSTASILASLSTDESLTLAWTESINVLASTQTEESLTVGLSDSATIAIMISSAGDMLSIGLDDVSAAPYILVSGSDAVAALLSESTTILSLIDRADDLTMGLQDAMLTILAILQREESAAVIVVDASAVMVPVSGADVVMIGLTESGVAIEVVLNRLGSVLIATAKRLAPIRTVLFSGGSRTVEVL